MAISTIDSNIHLENAWMNLAKTNTEANIIYITSREDLYIKNAVSFLKIGLQLQRSMVFIDDEIVWSIVRKRLLEQDIALKQVESITFVPVEKMENYIEMHRDFHVFSTHFWVKVPLHVKEKKDVEKSLGKGNITLFVYDGHHVTASAYLEWKNTYPYMMTDIECTFAEKQAKGIEHATYLKQQMPSVKDNEMSLSNPYFFRLIEEMLDAVFISTQHQILYANKAAKLLLGQSNFVGVSVEAFITKNSLQEVLKEAELNGWEEIVQPNEVKLRDIHNNTIEAEIICLPFFYQDHTNAYITIARDIRERKENQSLQLKNEKLGTAGQVAASIAHEIRNPLTAIKGFLKLVYEGAMNLKDIYPIVEIELNRMETIASELMYLGKPTQAEVKKTNIVQLIQEVCTLMQSQANLENIIIDLDIYNQHLYAKCNGDQIKQVFMNLVKNAMEAIENGGRIHMEARLVNEWIEVYIADTGNGIPSSLKDRLGQPFITTKESGTGLGLVICNKLIAEHKGTIDFISKEGEGTTFTIRLPYFE